MGNDCGDVARMNFLRDLITQAIDFKLYNVHTHLPAVILSYDPALKKVSVRPTIKKTLSDGTTASMPIISNVPLISPFGGNQGLSLPVKVGDYCLLMFSERSLDRWLTFGGEVDNSDPRVFDLNDAIAIAGLMPFNQTSGIANNEDIVLKNSNGTITIQSDGSVIINANGTIIKAQSNGKVAVGFGGIEILGQFSQLLQSIITNFGPLGPFPNPAFVTDATFIKVNVDSITGTL